MKWFGSNSSVGPAGIDRIAIPLGHPCAGCGSAIREGDRGVLIPPFDAVEAAEQYFHHACARRMIITGIDTLRAQTPPFGKS